MRLPFRMEIPENKSLYTVLTMQLSGHRAPYATVPQREAQ